MGRLLTILNLPGYTVSVIKYAHERDIKKALNEKFSEVFPHVRITLTKLRRYCRFFTCMLCHC